MVSVIYFAVIPPNVNGFTVYCTEIKAWNFFTQRRRHPPKTSHPPGGALHPWPPCPNVLGVCRKELCSGDGPHNARAPRCHGHGALKERGTGWERSCKRRPVIIKLPAASESLSATRPGTASCWGHRGSPPVLALSDLRLRCGAGQVRSSGTEARA